MQEPAELSLTLSCTSYLPYPKALGESSQAYKHQLQSYCWNCFTFYGTGNSYDIMLELYDERQHLLYVCYTHVTIQKVS